MDRSLNEILFSYTILNLEWCVVNISEGDFMKCCVPCLRTAMDPTISIKKMTDHGKSIIHFPTEAKHGVFLP